MDIASIHPANKPLKCRQPTEATPTFHASAIGRFCQGRSFVASPGIPEAVDTAMALLQP